MKPICFLLMLSLAGIDFPANCQSFKLKEGVIEGAYYAIAVPREWNGSLLLIAHGYIPESQPLNADFSPEKEVFQSLIHKGWVIASSSYRRNGLIIEDAIKDINNLYDQVENNLGKPKLTLLQGSSMGGLIGTLIAENPARDYHGVLNMGAGLQLTDSLEQIHLNHQPKTPILFLSNQSEYHPVKSYQQKAHGASVSLWKISRDGHVNINQSEQAQALTALERLVQGEAVPLVKDGTVNLHPSSSAVFEDGGAYLQIDWADPVYGNLYTTMVPADLTKLGINQGGTFELNYQKRGFQVFYGTTYHDVPVGSWVAFLSGEGTIQISCNFCNAAKMLNYQSGESLFIMK